MFYSVSSRWKERFFILTNDYFHCFKKGSFKVTEMGEFIFKVKREKYLQRNIFPAEIFSGEAELNHLGVSAGQERLPHHLPHPRQHQGGQDLSQVRKYFRKKKLKIFHWFNYRRAEGLRDWFSLLKVKYDSNVNTKYLLLTWWDHEVNIFSSSQPVITITIPTRLFNKYRIWFKIHTDL